MVKIIFLDNGEELVIGNNNPIALTKSIAEIKDLSKRKGTFSKTIVIPGNEKSNKILGHYYSINLTDSKFNRKVLTPISLTQNGQEIVRGYLRLINVNKSFKTAQTDTEVSYEVVVYDETSALFQELQGKNLNNLDFTEFNHTYSSANVVDSFTNTWLDGYKYTFPYSIDNQYELSDFKPAIYARQIWDKIFAGSGFSYQWDSIDDDSIRFSKLLLPYVGDKLEWSAEDFESFFVKAQQLAPQTFNSPTATIANGVQAVWTPQVNPIDGTYASNYQVLAGDELVDGGNNYNPATSVYTSPIYATGSQTFKAKIKINFDFNLVNPLANTAFLASSNTNDPYPANSTLGWDYNFRFRAVNQNNQLLGSGLINAATLTVSGDSGGNPITPFNINPGVNNISTTDFEFILTSTNLQIGDTVRIIVVGEPEIINEDTTATPRWRNNNPPPTFPEITNQIVINSYEIEFYPDPESFGFGATLNMNNTIPKMKQTDFIKGILNLYNLYVDIDKDNPNKLIIKTRDEYYDSGEDRDWTNRLVTQLEQNISFASEDSSRIKILKYKEGKTPFNQFYQNATGEVYGQFTYILEDHNLKGEDKIEIPFSPSPLVASGWGGIVHAYDGFAPKANVKLTYDGSVLTAPQPYSIVDYFQGTGGINPSGQLDLTEYSYSGHYDNPFTPSFDINFSKPQYVGYNGLLTETGNNIFNLHWRRTFNQINNAKILDAYFMLDEVEFANLNLNDRIFVYNEIYNIIEINDYNAASKTPTRVKLIQVDDNIALGTQGAVGPLPNPGGGPIPEIPNPGGDGQDNPNPVPGPVLPPRDDDNTVTVLQEELIKRKNINLGVGNTIKGLFNYLSDDSNYNSIIGDNNIIEGSNNNILSDNEILNINDTIETDGNVIINGDLIIDDINITENLEFIPNTFAFGTPLPGTNVIMSSIDSIIQYPLTAGTINNAIIGGTSHFIGDGGGLLGSYNSVILGGENNTIIDSEFSSIIAGNNNIISFGQNSVILGGNNITATQINTAYTANLVIVDSITPIDTADTQGVEGQVTWDDDYVYVKTSVGWKRSALATF